MKLVPERRFGPKTNARRKILKSPECNGRGMGGRKGSVRQNRDGLGHDPVLYTGEAIAENTIQVVQSYYLQSPVFEPPQAQSGARPQ